MHDAFVAFFVGMLSGGTLGIVAASLLSAVRECEERKESAEKQYIKEEEND
jgi:gas vesicle protein